MKFRKLSVNEMRNLTEKLLKEIDIRKKIIKEDFIKQGYISEKERLSYENIDMTDLEEDLLLLLYNYHINDRNKLNSISKIKQEKICLAAMCQFIKGEYHIRAYTKDYENLTGLKIDRKMYDILKNAFKQEGILPSNWDSMKGFKYKDTLINETGIPKCLANDLIELFKVYWKNLRQLEFDYVYENIDKVIKDNYIWDIKEVNILRESYNNLSEYPRKVKKVIRQLSQVCVLLEEGNYYEEDLSKDDIIQAINKLMKFDIFSILPRKESLKLLYIQILSKVSVNKFKNILESSPQNTKIRIPDKSEKTSRKYTNIQLGVHNINSPISRIYTVLPHPSLSINKLLGFKMDQFNTIKDNYIGYASKKKFNVSIGKNKIEESYPLYDSFRLQGYYWYGNIPSALPIIINGKEYEPNKFLDYSPIFKYKHNESLNTYYYNLILNGFKIYLPSYANEDIAIICNYSDEIEYIKIDKDGYIENKRIVFNINRKIDNTPINIEVYHYKDDKFDILYKEDIENINYINSYINNLKRNNFNETNFEYKLKQKNWKFNDKLIFHIEEYTTDKNRVITNIKNAENDIYVLANYNNRYTQFKLQEIINIDNNKIFICHDKLRAKIGVDEDAFKLNLKFIYNYDNIFESNIISIRNLDITLDKHIYFNKEDINIEIKYKDKVFKDKSNIEIYTVKDMIVPKLIPVSIYIEDIDTYHTQYINPDILYSVITNKSNNDILDIETINYEDIDLYNLEIYSSNNVDIEIYINDENVNTIKNIKSVTIIDISEYKEKFKYSNNNIVIKQMNRSLEINILRKLENRILNNINTNLKWYEIDEIYSKENLEQDIRLLANIFKGI